MKAIDCRDRAAHARLCALNTPLPVDQLAWQVMARQWASLGDLAELQERLATALAAG
jgi:hypothetical protein